MNKLLKKRYEYFQKILTEGKGLDHNKMAGKYLEVGFSIEAVKNDMKALRGKFYFIPEKREGDLKTHRYYYWDNQPMAEKNDAFIKIKKEDWFEQISFQSRNHAYIKKLGKEILALKRRITEIYSHLNMEWKPTEELNKEWDENKKVKSFLN